jgi:hypothetical protein
MPCLLTLIIISYLSLTSSAFFLKPAIYNAKHTNKTICNSPLIDRNNQPDKRTNIPYLTCLQEGRIQVVACRLVLATPTTCLFSFPGNRIDPVYPNVPTTLGPNQKLINSDCTEQMKAL